MGLRRPCLCDNPGERDSRDCLGESVVADFPRVSRSHSNEDECIGNCACVSCCGPGRGSAAGAARGVCIAGAGHQGSRRIQRLHGRHPGERSDCRDQRIGVLSGAVPQQRGEGRRARDLDGCLSKDGQCSQGRRDGKPVASHCTGQCSGAGGTGLYRTRRPEMAGRAAACDPRSRCSSQNGQAGRHAGCRFREAECADEQPAEQRGGILSAAAEEFARRAEISARCGRR